MFFSQRGYILEQQLSMSLVHLITWLIHVDVFYCDGDKVASTFSSNEH